MFYIHKSKCISPQLTYDEVQLDAISPVVDNKLLAIEPPYDFIPVSMLRRMGKAVRMGVGTALPLLKDEQKPDGIIIGTANGGMEDCIRFLNQIIDYEEGILTPTNFVQSTSNAIAGQVGMLSSNQGYNITHVHRGLSFENALLDTAMLLKENKKATYLLGGLDEISIYNYTIDYLGGCFKEEKVTEATLYETPTAGTIAGEGSAMFLVSNIEENAVAQVIDLDMIHTNDPRVLAERLEQFLQKNKVENALDLFLSGENGDVRQADSIKELEAKLKPTTAIARFKHITGDHPTASAISLWLAVQLMITQSIPTHMIKKGNVEGPLKNVLIYNHFKHSQHSFMLVRV